MHTGKVILLNGASCAGKSAIARVLQTMLGEPCFTIGIDPMLGCLIDNDYFIDDPFLYLGEQPLQERAIHQQSEARFNTLMDVLFPHFFQGFHASIAAYAGTGVTVIVDHLFHEKDWLLHCLHALRHTRVYSIGVHCALDRENSRTGQLRGMVAYQFERVHRYCQYDFTVDTTHKPPSKTDRPSWSTCATPRHRQPLTACARNISCKPPGEVHPPL